MPDTPNYSFHRIPRFSANQLAEYLSTSNASQREAIIRRAKFPRKVSVIAYSQALPWIGKFLARNTHDLSYFDDVLSRLAAKERRESGYNKDEAKRCQTAIEAFKDTFSGSTSKRLQFTAGPQDLSFKQEGMRVNVRLDAPIIEHKDGQMFSGGCVLLMASTPEARKNIEDRRKNVAALIHWSLEEGSSQFEPLARLCLSIDPFGGEITRAPTAHSRLRAAIASACHEAALRWPAVRPPSGYDGPDWR